MTIPAGKEAFTCFRYKKIAYMAICHNSNIEIYWMSGNKIVRSHHETIKPTDDNSFEIVAWHASTNRLLVGGLDCGAVVKFI